MGSTGVQAYMNHGQAASQGAARIPLACTGHTHSVRFQLHSPWPPSSLACWMCPAGQR